MGQAAAGRVLALNWNRSWKAMPISVPITSRLLLRCDHHATTNDSPALGLMEMN